MQKIETAEEKKKREKAESDERWRIHMEHVQIHMQMIEDLQRMQDI